MSWSVSLWRARALRGFCISWLLLILSGFTVQPARAITLDAALSRTLEKNPEVAQARIALEQAAGHRLVFRSTGLPDVRIQGLAGVRVANALTNRPFSHSLLRAVFLPSRYSTRRSRLPGGAETSKC